MAREISTQETTHAERNCPALKCRATKAEMVETIRNREANAWLLLEEHEFHNAPVRGGKEAEMAWCKADTMYQILLSTWSALNSLCEELNIETGKTWQYEEASKLSSDLFLRRKACAGIYYNPKQVYASHEKLYYDTESSTTISEYQLLLEWGMQPAAERRIGETFAEYLANCLSKNGFLEEVM